MTPPLASTTTTTTTTTTVCLGALTALALCWRWWLVGGFPLAVVLVVTESRCVCPGAQHLFAQHGDREVLASDYIEEMGPTGKSQRRVLCVTDAQVYNVDPKDFKLHWSAPLHSLALIVTMPLRDGMLLAFESSGPQGRRKREGGPAFLCFSCERSERRGAILRLLDRHTPNAVPMVECDDQPAVIPLIQRHQLLAGSPLAEWFVEAQHSDFDSHGFEPAAAEAAAEQWRAMKYSDRVEQQRAAWQKFVRKYQGQLRSARTAGPGVRFDQGGREYTDSGSATALVVPKKLARGGLPPEQRGEIWQVEASSAPPTHRNTLSAPSSAPPTHRNPVRGSAPSAAPPTHRNTVGPCGAESARALLTWLRTYGCRSCPGRRPSARWAVGSTTRWSVGMRAGSPGRHSKLIGTSRGDTPNCSSPA